MPIPALPGPIADNRWVNILGDDNRRAIETRLPAFLAAQRWFGGKGEALAGATLLPIAEISDNGPPGFALTVVATESSGGGRQHYFLPLAIEWGSGGGDVAGEALAQFGTGDRIGVLYDALAAPHFVRRLVDGIERGVVLAGRDGRRLTLTATAAMAAYRLAPDLTIAALGKEQSNTSVRVGEAMIFKAYRRLQAGIHPEVEIGRHLTEVAGFTHAPQLFGWMQLEDADGELTALGILQQFVESEGDAWSFTLDFLRSMLSRGDALPAGTAADAAGLFDPYLPRATMLGRRVGELHLAFALPSDDDGFRPEPVTGDDIARWRHRAAEQAAAARRALTVASSGLALRVLQRWPAVEQQLQTLLPADLDTVRIRHHGDLHFGQLMVVGDDFCILDFEGEPLRPLAERREKNCPLRDVAGIVRSFAYAREAAARDRLQAGLGADANTLAMLTHWETRAVQAFIAGYRSAAAGCPAVPAADATFARVLDFFILEKALYEVCYERENRPDWLDLPLRSLELPVTDRS